MSNAQSTTIAAFVDHVFLETAGKFEYLKKLPDASIDLLCTDPPYGISFMRRDWDKALPGVEIWNECFRVLKPGAFAFVMSLPRSDCYAKMVGRLIEAGFELAFTPIFWTHASGFPKSRNISKAVDKKLGVEPTIVGEHPAPNATGWVTKNKVGEKPVYLTIPTTTAAKELEGSYAGFQPKPVVEVIIVAMKPLSEETYVDQALKNKKGVTWLDDCRVPYAGRSDKEENQREQKYGSTTTFFGGKPLGDYTNDKGRFPANLVVNDDALNDGGDSGSFSRYFDMDKWWEERVKQLPESVQRTFPFLIVSKASKSEKNEGLEGLEKRKKCAASGDDHVMNEICPTHHKTLCECGWRSKPIANFHPTVKPLKLMSYLITLGSREGDIVLDPFVGSGTTAIASAMLKRNYIGMEISQEYIDIAEARLAHWKDKKDTVG